MSGIRVLQVGLGPIGVEVARLAAQKESWRLVGAVDPDPKLVGLDLGDVLREPRWGVVVEADLGAALSRLEPQLVLHATGSHLPDVAPQLRACLRAKAAVVSTCEELAYPFYRHPELSRELDALARTCGVSLLGTGINPGFVMDKLVATLLAACTEVESVRIARVVDASTRREPLQKKIGAGLSVKEFEARKATGRFGHVGLAESAHAVADVLGLPRSRKLEETFGPVVAEREVKTRHLTVKPGQAQGMRQTARVLVDGRERVALDLLMAVGAGDPRDTVSVTGTPPLEMTITGGIHGDVGTAAVTVHAALLARDLAPGLRTMLDVPVRYRRK
jgi:4-hydroxy-tetrahydrodipicolinate reductase